MSKHVPYELAVMLKEKGFDESTISFYSYNSAPFKGVHERKNSEIGNMYSAPTYQDVIDWFFEKHNIWITLECVSIKSNNQESRFYYNVDKNLAHQADEEMFGTHYLALDKAFEVAVKLI